MDGSCGLVDWIEVVGLGLVLSKSIHIAFPFFRVG